MAIHCPVCGWRFGSEKSLQKHLAAHHTEAEQRAASQPQASPLPEPPPDSRPGWYQLPSGKGIYFDGSEWVGWASPEPEPEPRRVGGLALVLSYVAAVFLPIAGLLVGIWLLAWRRSGHGVAVLLISVVIGAASTLPLLLSSHDSGGTPTSQAHSGGGKKLHKLEKKAKCARGQVEPGSTRLNDCIDQYLVR